MIIGLTDLPNHNHDFIKIIIRDLKGEIPLIYLNGEKEKVEKYKGTKSEIVIWDNPHLVENDEIDFVDKVLEIVRFKGSLSKEENEIVREREKLNYHRYIIGSRGVHEEVIPFIEYYQQWIDEIQGKVILTDEKIREVTEEMVKEHQIDVNIHMESAHFLGTLARYLYWVNRITMNPYRIRRSSVQTIEDLQITIAHEIGHKVDPLIEKLSKEKTEARQNAKNAETIDEFKKWFSIYRDLLLKIEQNAWDNCYQFCPSHIDKEEIKRREKNGMFAYVNLLKKEKTSFLKKLEENQRRSEENEKSR